MTAELMDPHALRFWDEGADENRGGSYTAGIYKSREAAQAECDRLNEPILQRINADAWSKYERELAQWKGFRREVMPVEPTPLTATTFQDFARRHNNDGTPCRAYPWHDHYYVEPVEFDG